MLFRWLVVVATAVVVVPGCSSLSGSRAGAGARGKGATRQPPEAARRATKPNWKPAQLDATAFPGAEPALLHACEDLIVVDKPAGWLTHDDGTVEGRPSVASWVAEKYGGKPGVHQRLDIDCSGVLCFARWVGSILCHNASSAGPRLGTRCFQTRLRVGVRGKFTTRWWTRCAKGASTGGGRAGDLNCP
jgi:hypothetical protein